MLKLMFPPPPLHPLNTDRHDRRKKDRKKEKERKVDRGSPPPMPTHILSDFVVPPPGYG